MNLQKNIIISHPIPPHPKNKSKSKHSIRLKYGPPFIPPINIVSSIGFTYKQDLNKLTKSKYSPISVSKQPRKMILEAGINSGQIDLFKKLKKLSSISSFHNKSSIYNIYEDQNVSNLYKKIMIGKRDLSFLQKKAQKMSLIPA